MADVQPGGTSTDSGSESAKHTANRFQLRPSLLDKHAMSIYKDASTSASPFRGMASFKLEPPKLCSPLSSKFTDNNKTPSANVSSTVHNNDGESTTADDGDASKTTEELKVSNSSSCSAEPVFICSRLPIIQTSATSNMAASCTGVSSAASGVQSNFVFGSNLADRVVMAASETVEVAPVSSTTKECTSEDKNDGHDVTTSPQSLAESAALQQAKMSHVELKEVEVVTGEEDESNVFQFSVKLFIFDKRTQSWLERGLGLLRLNDKCTAGDNGTFQSRLVMRVQGSLRVILNTMIWPGMLIERSSKKSIKISAIDSSDDSVRIFLIQANPSDTDQIFSAISARAQKLKTGDSGKSQHPDCSEKRLNNTSSVTEKRPSDAMADTETFTEKRRRLDPEQRREQVEEESNDSSAVDPETEASNEGFSSSPPIQSSSSDA